MISYDVLQEVSLNFAAMKPMLHRMQEYYWTLEPILCIDRRIPLNAEAQATQEIANQQQTWAYAMHHNPMMHINFIQYPTHFIMSSNRIYMRRDIYFCCQTLSNTACTYISLPISMTQSSPLCFQHSSHMTLLIKFSIIDHCWLLHWSCFLELLHTWSHPTS